MFLHLTKSALDYSFLPLINSKLKARSGEPEIFALTPSNFQMFSTVSFKGMILKLLHDVTPSVCHKQWRCQDFICDLLHVGRRDCGENL